MYRGVLVTIDGSRLSETVLTVVADLVAGTGAAVTLLTVGQVPAATVEPPRDTSQPYIYLSPSAPAVRSPLTTPRYVETKTQAIERSAERLKAYLDEKATVLRARGIEVRTTVEFGKPEDKIIQCARQPEIDLVAMATHGHTGVRTLIFESVAGRVLGSGVRPVILVHPRSRDYGWREDTRLQEPAKAKWYTRAGNRGL